jgi:hypothetical protein
VLVLVSGAIQHVSGMIGRCKVVVDPPDFSPVIGRIPPSPSALAESAIRVPGNEEPETRRRWAG